MNQKWPVFDIILWSVDRSCFVPVCGSFSRSSFHFFLRILDIAWILVCCHHQRWNKKIKVLADYLKFSALGNDAQWMNNSPEYSGKDQYGLNRNLQIWGWETRRRITSFENTTWELESWGSLHKLNSRLLFDVERSKAVESHWNSKTTTKKLNLYSS